MASADAENVDAIAEVMLIIQVCVWVQFAFKLPRFDL